jgi:4-aminobutyrate aminotransferase-like enzyme
LIAIAVHPGSVLLLAPPLIISEEEISTMIDMFDVALTALSALNLQ